MEETITINVTKSFKIALKKYCKDRNVDMSNFIKLLVANKLIEENYIKTSEGEIKNE